MEHIDISKIQGFIPMNEKLWPEFRQKIYTYLKGTLSAVMTEDDLNIAKDAIISSINMSLDMPGRIIDQYLFHNISDLDLIDERISQYKTVSLKDIKIVAKKIKSNTIYVLEGDTHEKN